MLGILGRGTRVTRAAIAIGVEGLGLGVKGLAEEEEELKELERVY